MKPKNKHIAVLTPGFPENEADTTCIPALQIYIKALKETAGIAISVITFHYPKKKGLYYWNDIPVYALGGGFGIKKIKIWRNALKTLKELHQENPIAFLHSFWLGECALIGHWFSKRNHISHLTTLMGQDTLPRNMHAKILPLKKMRFISLSAFHQKNFYGNYNVVTEVIPFGVDTKSFPSATAKTIDIIGVGSLIPVKNQDLFIDIIFQLNKTKPIKAVLIGGGILKDELQKKIDALQLNDVIALRGELPHHETLDYFSKSKILLHTSNHEGFGLIYAEALASGTMIVSKNVGYVLPSSNWLVVATEAEMTEACAVLLSKSFSTEEKNPFVIEKTVQYYLDIYNG